MLECGGMLFLSAALQRLICFLRQELENATLSASGTVGPCNTFLTRLGRKADFNFLRAMPVKKGSPPLTQVSDAGQRIRCCCQSTSKSYSP